MSKLDQLKALGDAKRAARKEPKPLPGGVTMGLPLSVAVTNSMLGIANPVAKATKGKIRTAGQDKDASRKTMVNPPDGVVSRLGAGRTAQDAAPSSDGGRVAIQAECPVCAARRLARAAAQKKWRRKKEQAK